MQADQRAINFMPSSLFLGIITSSNEAGCIYYYGNDFQGREATAVRISLPVAPKQFLKPGRFPHVQPGPLRVDHPLTGGVVCTAVPLH